MTRVTLIWGLVIGACGTMALPHLFIGLRQRRAIPNVLFAICALSVAAIAVGELAIMTAQTTAQIGKAQQWTHVPIFTLTVALVCFVRLHFGTGRWWLGIAACALRGVALAINFALPPNLNFREVTAVQHLRFLGETVSVPEGVVSSWTHLGELSSLLVLAFVVDASIALWRAEKAAGRRRAVVIGGSIVFFILIAAGVGAMIHTKAVHWPYLISIPFLGVIAAMAFELGYDVLRVGETVQQLRDSEAALRESEERINLAAEAGNLALWIRDMEADQVWMTEKGRTLFGFSKSEPLTFNRFLQTVHNADRQHVDQALSLALAGGADYETEYRILQPDGKVRWIAGLGRVQFAHDGTPVSIRGVARDITARKGVEEALKESEARFRSVANAAPVMIWMSGPDKLCNFFNNGWLDFTGRRIEDELGTGWAEGIHPEDLKRCLEVYETSFDARRSFTMEYRLRRNDGEYRLILDSGTPRSADDGTFLGYIGSCIDITELRQAEKKFRAVLDAAPNAMLMVDTGGIIRFANTSATTVFGYSEDELFGIKIETLIPERFHKRHPGYRESFSLQPSQRTMGSGRDLFGRRRDGSEFPVEIGLNPIHIGEELFVVASVIDITTRKQAELQQEIQQIELARVGRVTLLGELAASLAHEVNNPVGAMVTNAYAGQRIVAAEQIDIQELRDLFADIISDGHRAREVIHGIRTMVRKGETSRSLVHIPELIDDLGRIVRGDALRRQVTIMEEVDSQSGAVMADRGQLLQVLLNLTINAFEAMSATPQKQRRLAIRSGRKSKGKVFVSLRDTGPGIPEEIIERMFEPFFSTKNEGTGMGLAIARTIVERHGGTLSGQNCEGGGALFTVCFSEANGDKPNLD